jgi:hypothetical protein
MPKELQEEIDEFFKKIKARALLEAADWAGGHGRLARMSGLTQKAGEKWLERGFIPPLAAFSLSLISNFPLSFKEMCPASDRRVILGYDCRYCHRKIVKGITKTGCSPILKARSEADARKLADDPEKAARLQKIRKRRACKKFAQ